MTVQSPDLKRRSACAALLGGALVSARVNASDHPCAPPRAAWNDVRTQMREVVREAGTPSVSVAVALDGRLAFAHATGWADRARRIAASTQTVYSIASVSKPITATAVMRLVERGLIGLDQPANRLLGTARLRGWNGDADTVTVRHLLSHTAGLPEHLDFHYVGDAPPPPMATTLRRYGVVAFDPGTVYQYANLGYGALAAIVAEQARRPFAEVVRREVFAPLGMVHASVRGAKVPPGAARRHDASGHVLPDYTFLDVDGASAVHATALDLARFGLAHLGLDKSGVTRPLSAASIAAMQERATPAGVAYGLGWELGEERRVAVVQHSGGMPGVRARLCLVPSRRAVIVMLVNGEAWPESLYERLLSLVGLPEVPPTTTPDAIESPVLESKLPSDFFGAWRGTVRTHEAEVPFSFELRADGSAITSHALASATPVGSLTYKDGFLYGLVDGTVPTADARRRPGQAWLQLRACCRADPLEAPTLAGVVYQDSVANEPTRYTLGAPLRLIRTA